uniref:Uncharacterized protein n=1 Tax=Oryza brachyantha TaxID=4533 RepID=J3LXN8_ORYBR
MALFSWAIAEVPKKGFTPLITLEVIRSYVVEKCGFLSREQNTRADGKPSELWQCGCWSLEAPVVPAPSSAGKPKWKASIDFKWIWENTGTVSANIHNHNYDES